VSALARRGWLRVVGRPAPATSLHDAELVAALRDGSLGGLAAAFDQWHDRVRILARRLLGDDAAAEDVVQEVFSALPRAVGAFREETTLEAFVLSIAVKRSRHHRRAASDRGRALARLGAQEDVVFAAPGDPEVDAYRRQLAARMARALDDLPHPQRVAFVLCEVEGMTAGEAAAIADAPEATVRTRLFHARRRLRAALAAERAE
jgi:RNA polymerase sigma-70 factor (ECF subfamily)